MRSLYMCMFVVMRRSMWDDDDVLLVKEGCKWAIEPTFAAFLNSAFPGRSPIKSTLIGAIFSLELFTVKDLRDLASSAGRLKRFFAIVGDVPVADVIRFLSDTFGLELAMPSKLSKEIDLVVGYFAEATTDVEKVGAVTDFRRVLDKYLEQYPLGSPVEPLADFRSEVDGSLGPLKLWFAAPPPKPSKRKATTKATARTAPSMSQTTVTTTAAPTTPVPSPVLADVLSSFGMTLSCFLLDCAGLSTQADFHRAANDMFQAKLLMALLGESFLPVQNVVGGKVSLFLNRWKNFVSCLL